MVACVRGACRAATCASQISERSQFLGKDRDGNVALIEASTKPTLSLSFSAEIVRGQRTRTFSTGSEGTSQKLLEVPRLTKAGWH